MPKADWTRKAAQLRASAARLLSVPEHDLYLPAPNVDGKDPAKPSDNGPPNPADEPRIALCLLNVGVQGFIAIEQAAFARLVADLGPGVAHAWMPLGKNFSFVVFHDEPSALRAYSQFHGHPTPHLPKNNGRDRIGLAAFVRALRIAIPTTTTTAASDDDLDSIPTPPLPAIPGLTLHRAAITPAEERALLDAIASIPDSEWTAVHGRRVVHFGYEFVYSSFSLTPTRTFPPWLAALHPLARRYLGGHTPTQATVSVYPPKAGIASHVDIPEFGPYLAALSMGSGTAMDFKLGEVEEEVYLWPRSVVAMVGPARSEWAHGIRGRRADAVAGRIVPREGERVSIVWRSTGEADDGDGGRVAPMERVDRVEKVTADV
ncbi:hypothetical protein AMAG_14610 [Allomyces macrogynus ATCC 38327]|uniref:Fe2OG dioxygenase domain-containing protein n=1 Tax=Allomyces macrogynus (strain ATCC 38327) TaxID=578462 RepID=A0A0L0T6Y2_ALLM3|nr:hypothetical protein AMAG_14610 [Allomyces macrogynus ATCC 38327]|eukprot:KNE70485.1 hypothetical protein AMAG_14610 [Allomyces macrogynus ATCC 38327]